MQCFSACFNVVYMSELRVPILWFNLRAPTPHSAAVWMKKIHLAQVIVILLQLNATSLLMFLHIEAVCVTD